MQQQRGGQEAESLAVADLVVVHGVGARHAQQAVLAQPARLAEEVVRRERARDVALDHRLERTLLPTGHAVLGKHAMDRQHK